LERERITVYRGSQNVWGQARRKNLLRGHFKPVDHNVMIVNIRDFRVFGTNASQGIRLAGFVVAYELKDAGGIVTGWSIGQGSQILSGRPGYLEGRGSQTPQLLHVVAHLVSQRSSLPACHYNLPSSHRVVSQVPRQHRSFRNNLSTSGYLTTMPPSPAPLPAGLLCGVKKDYLIHQNITAGIHLLRKSLKLCILAQCFTL
jgi:hypothetical protein